VTGQISWWVGPARRGDGNVSSIDVRRPVRGHQSMVSRTRPSLPPLPPPPWSRGWTRPFSLASPALTPMLRRSLGGAVVKRRYGHSEATGPCGLRTHLLADCDPQSTILFYLFIYSQSMKFVKRVHVI